MLLDQRRTRNAASGAEVLAPENRTGDRRGIVEVNLARLARSGCSLSAQGRKRELRALADERQPHIDHLDRLVGRMVRVALLVKRVEGLADGLAVAGHQLGARDRDREREFLA